MSLPISAVDARAFPGGVLAGEKQHPRRALEDSCQILGEVLAFAVLPSLPRSELHGQVGNP